MKVAVYGTRPDRVATVAMLADDAGHDAFPLNREEHFYDMLAATPEMVGVLVASDHVAGCDMLIDWRKNNLATPILALLHERDTGLRELARLLMAGADSAQLLPGEPEHLKACMSALGRRLNIPAPKHTKLIGGAVFDQDLGEVRCGIEVVQLAPKIAALFALLIRCNGRLISEQHIIAELYDEADEPADPHIVKVMVCKLRKQLDLILDRPVIETVWARGFRYVADGCARGYATQARAA